MAYAAVMHLMQLLEEELIQFPCRVLETQEEKVRDFHLKANKVIRKLDKFKTYKDVPSSCLVALRKGLHPLAPTIKEDIVLAARSPEAPIDSRSILTRISDLVSEIDAMNSSLEAFVQKLEGAVIGNSSAALSKQRELVNELLSANNEFKKVISFFNQVAEEAVSLYDTICNLLGQLENSNNHQLGTVIKIAMEKAGDSIQAFLTDNPFFFFAEKDSMEVKKTFELLKVQSFREERVAYDAVVFLMQLLEEQLMPFLCRVLENEVEKAGNVQLKANMVVSMLKTSNNSEDAPFYHLVEQKEEIKSLAATSYEEWIEASQLTKGQPLDRRKILTRIPDIVSELDAISNSLEYVHEFNGSVTGHPSPTTSKKREIANDLLSTVEGIKKLITLFNQAAEEAFFIYDIVGIFLTNINHSKNHEVVNLIKIAADKAGDSIKSYLAVSQFLLVAKPFVVDQILLYLLKDIGQSLSHTLEEVSNCIQRDNEEDNASSDLHLSSDSQRQSIQSPDDLFSTPAESKEDTGLKDSQADVAAGKAGVSVADILPGVPFLLETDGLSAEKSTLNLLKDIGQLMSYTLEEVSQLQRLQAPVDLFSISADKKEDDSFEDVAEDDYITKIIDELTRPPLGLKFVRIKGMGGIDKTTLAKKVFQDPKVIYHFHSVTWVNCTSTDQVLSDLLHFIDRSKVDIQEMSVREKGELLNRNLLGVRYLIVLDGSRAYEALDTIENYLPDRQVGSRILTTSCLLNYLMELPNSKNVLKRPHPMTFDSSQGSSVTKEFVVGLDVDADKIINELTVPTSSLKIVTITGRGGSGKTTLAKKVFGDPRVVYKFSRLGWVNCDSSILQLLSHLLHSIDPSYYENHGQSCADIGDILRKRLKRIKYLIIIDGLWDFEVWDAIHLYLPDDNMGSRILITSCFVEFPTVPIISKNLHCMRPLDENQSWKLLEKLIFGRESCPNKLVGVGKQIAERCGGLPLAIVIIAGTLSRIPRSYGAWLNIVDSVNSIVSPAPAHTLSLRYNYLPHHLKACLLFMGAFPQYGDIEIKKLIDLWIAESFLNSKSSNELEKVAEGYLEDLIDRNLVMVRKRGLDGKVKACLIEKNLQQFCLRQAQKENFLRVLETDTTFHGLDEQRRLFFDMDICDDVEMLPPLPHLQSFIWLSPQSDLTPGNVVLKLSGFKWMKVLDMYLLPLESFPVELLNLVNLRYLALDLTYELDASISQLWKLQTLIINGPWNPIEGEENPNLSLDIGKCPG